MPVFVIFVPAAVSKTCDATWWLKARSEQKQRTREARVDDFDRAFVDDLDVVAADLGLRVESLDPRAGLAAPVLFAAINPWRSRRRRGHGGRR